MAIAVSSDPSLVRRGGLVQDDIVEKDDSLVEDDSVERDNLEKIAV
jgi:hypothetical protein